MARSLIEFTAAPTFQKVMRSMQVPPLRRFLKSHMASMGLQANIEGGRVPTAMRITKAMVT